MYALTNGILHAGEQDLIDQAVLIEGERIIDLVPNANLPSEIEQVNAKGNHITPGFIDMQLNGCGGVMFNDAITSATLETMHQTNLKSGTTSYLPTLITCSDADILKALEVVYEYRQHSPHHVLGLHLEGPYLNPKRKGIHNEAYIRKPDRTMLKEIAAMGRETVKLITLAPEEVEPEDIRLLAEQGILVAAGHTDATYEQAMGGFDAGVRMATHLFNAMSPWLGRNPGMVGAIFSREEVYAGIIADGYHTHFGSIALAQKLKQDKLILVTDATPPVGTQMESFMIGGQQVFYKDGKCVSADGTLGGSALTMIEAVANCVNHLNLPLAEALRMASLYPAQAMGIDDQFGKIARGYVANLTMFDDEFQVTSVIDRGTYLKYK